MKSLRSDIVISQQIPSSTVEQYVLNYRATPLV